MSEIKTFPGVKGTPSVCTYSLELDSLPEARQTHGEIIKSYARGEISEHMLRALVYSLTSLLGYFKLEKEFSDFDEFKKQLERIEERNRNEFNRT